ncbi:MAG: type II toxin-antitoxin system RelE/ParE family toxin [Syntrophobacteraceae bacterium]|nr:type II toxin-antitoxin system RelE/ParE family toxin [Syntrophobacteraceae bacterium]
MTGSSKTVQPSEFLIEKRLGEWTSQFITEPDGNLQQLEAATRIEDLYFPPSNKLHALQGHSPMRYSIWISEQWRISFEWSGDRAEDVLFED